MANLKAISSSATLSLECITAQEEIDQLFGILKEPWRDLKSAICYSPHAKPLH